MSLWWPQQVLVQVLERLLWGLELELELELLLWGLGLGLGLGLLEEQQWRHRNQGLQ
jgi:hypothetical protein